MAEICLKRHFETGSDYTGVNDCAVGSNSEVFNVEALRRVIKLLGKADHSEYMTWYMRNNKDVFKVDIIDLPPQYVRDYRLTLDYEEDLNMFEALLTKMEELKLEQNLTNVFKVLDEYPEIPKMNGHLTLKYKADKEFIDFLNKVTKIHLPK
jgi:N,N'-diacetyllegionaminate synthase